MFNLKYSGIAALVLLAASTFILIVGHPGGFEGQIAWLFGLLPGALVIATFAHSWSEIPIDSTVFGAHRL